jgi:hypothetical protein
MVGRKVGVTFKLNDSAVSDVNENTTSTMTTSTVGPDYLFFDWYTHITSSLSSGAAKTALMLRTGSIQANWHCSTILPAKQAP